ncbi:hypothetical protein EJB05_36740, partial [Eragrostis curvula]
MKPSMPRTMRAPSRLLIVYIAAAATAWALQVRAQPDGIGFVSIDCGLPGTASYVSDTTKLLYLPDDAFIDTGSNHNISAEYVTPQMSRRYYNARSFPDGVRNCYTLRSLVAGRKYLIRAAFLYGNYDGLGRLPSFDLYVGVNFWGTVNISSPDATGTDILEAIVVVPDDFVQVCLMNTGSGTPFISSLDLRPLKSTMYPQVNTMQGLSLFDRYNFGPTDYTLADIVRYPDDPHDRVWFPRVNTTAWNSLSVTKSVVNNDLADVPSKVMQTAITPSNASSNIKFSWVAKSNPNHTVPRYVANMHFSELKVLLKNESREFYINVNGELWYPSGITPDYLGSAAIYSTEPFPASAQYEVSINATANSTLPPIINAAEIFSIISTTNLGTDAPDVSAITAVKANYRVQKNWMGDPCAPKTLAWDGLTCSYVIPTPRITGVDLSHNNFTGSIPDVLSQLSSLTFLYVDTNLPDVTDNQLSGSIPPGLLKRVQDGTLNLRYGDNPNLCTNGVSCQTTKGKNKVAIYISVPVVLVVVIGLLAALIFCLLKRKNQGSTNNAMKPQNEAPTSHVPPGGHDANPQSSLQIENRRFTYNELKVITNNFQRVLGKGGFGKVYDGFLEDGTQVAVKLRSQSSNQGVNEFLAEAQTLTRIHHKNLVSMIGYCKDGQYMALVYEYMPEGTLQDQIAGNSRNGRCLTWRQRLRIALESAQGLEYLHKGCNPPLIHRDVKGANILLNQKLEAKIADFGLSKAFNHDNEAQILTNKLVGTPGYVDPEYYETMQPTTKSDVYSFGVVLLELITGRQAVIYDPEPTNIIHWVRQLLARGNIEGVVDARMESDYDVNSVWKTAEMALKCTVHMSVQRPTMTEVVAQLQDCLELEKGRASDDANVSFYTGRSGDPDSDNQSVGVSQSSSAYAMGHNFRNVPTSGTGPIAR